MMYPLVLDLADDNIPVAVTRRVIGFSKQALHKWQANPVRQRDWDDAQLINAASAASRPSSTRPSPLDGVGAGKSGCL